ncbi:hypothetical protein HU200_001180 [Digitaria exilis]|uniref:LACTB2 winged helix domain-containing protein n=1 Tax=Digitaria exilis TaxID=1010633 RepID=A0A835L0D0_9POAL|nr:hypothetical protein HU200_001180 [Digitaria exilis]
MGSPSYRLAAAITVPSAGEFLVVRQPRPPSPPEEEDYRRFVDSDLYDLPSAPLKPLAGEARSEVAIAAADSVAHLDLSRLDVSAALDQIFDQFGLPDGMRGEWRLLKYVEEAEFGPDAGVNTVFVIGSLEAKLDALPESCKWMAKESALGLLTEAKPCSDRIGPYAYIGLLNLELSSNNTAVPVLPSQEYPPGINLVPMKSKTLPPFRTTNLVVVQATNGAGGSTCSDFFACGDALLLDPGCSSQIDYTSITGGEKICIGDQELQVVFAPGHTDGHMGLLHVNTNALIVGDHCVGHGSATLDSRSGGNMKDYFETTYKFLDLSPHVLIPMHGRINLWPKHMLCGYLRNRRSREACILQSIENGAQTLFEIVSKTYSDVDRKLWIPASFNVRLHVDHLNSQNKLPKVSV